MNRRPVRSLTTLDDLDGARAVVTTETMLPGVLVASIGGTDTAVRFRGTPDVLRRLLADALAQLDAIGPTA